MEIVFLRQAYKFVRKADKPMREKIKAEVLEIANNPGIGKFLKGKQLKHVQSHRFNYQKASYRIAYTVKGNLLIISIASRENFYKDLQK